MALSSAIDCRGQREHNRHMVKIALVHSGFLFQGSIVAVKTNSSARGEDDPPALWLSFSPINRRGHDEPNRTVKIHNDVNTELSFSLVSF